MSNEFNYDIHGITSIASDVWLPELAAFQVGDGQGEPNIRVQTRWFGGSKGRAQLAAADYRHLHYAEGLGPLGFGADIRVYNANRIEIRATPVLRLSPHVLYTNLVEPILRWNFVEKGYSLVHGACIVYGDDAYLITARTDTGKTTTILRILDERRGTQCPASFVSDDLTLVTPDGLVMTYPKPLTISYHTLAAVNQPLLALYERMTLPLQSRIHSRSGRRLALLLAKTWLPMATLNMLIQCLIPPPKYHVDRLVPGVTITQQAKLAGLFVIERGGQGDQLLESNEAIEILLNNCDDAYGFPPYQALESFLRLPNGSDLRSVEQQIVRQAFQGKPARLLRSSNYDWAKRIPIFTNGATVQMAYS